MGTELILCCPDFYADSLTQKVGLLERSPAAVSDEGVVVETRPSIPRPVVLVD